MSKNRYIDTRFWHDQFIREYLNPLDRYLFLYFLTNDKTNICGIYENPISTIASETGIDKEMLIKMLDRLRGKIHYIDGWIYIKNFKKYQNCSSPKIKKGIEVEELKIPQKIKDEISKIDKIYGIDTISHLNINSNINSNSNINKEADKSADNTYNILKNQYNSFLLNYYSQDHINTFIFKQPKELKQLTIFLKRFKDIEDLKKFLSAAKSDKWIESNYFLPSILNSQFSKIGLKAIQVKPEYIPDVRY